MWPVTLPPSLPRTQLFGICTTPAACILSEYCGRGSLAAVLRAARRDPAAAARLPWSRRLGYALGAARGMQFLHGHEPPIVHRDMKSPNLLIDDADRCKIADFK